MSRQIPDSFDFMQEKPRGRFAENEDEGPRVNEGFRSDLRDLNLLYCGQTPLAIAVKKPDSAGPWIWLPKSLIEFEWKGKSAVRVTLPERLAIEKGLL